MKKSQALHLNHIKNLIFRFALRLLANSKDAEDVTQDILEKLWKRKIHNIPHNNEEALALKMTKELCLDRLRHEKMKSEKLKHFDTQEINDDLKFENKDIIDITKQLINALPEKQKMVFHLRDIEGFEYNEMIEVLQMDINAIRMNLSRARKTIREQIIKITNYGL